MDACPYGRDSGDDVLPQSVDISWLLFWTALPVLLLTQAVIIVTTLRWRAQAGQTVARVRGNTRLDIVWAVVPALMLAALLVMTYETLHAGR